MSSEGFFSRWSRLKSQASTDAGPPEQTRVPPELPEQAPAPAGRLAGDPENKLPTLQDVSQLSAESDFSAFVSPGVDKTVRRLAMKKLFSNPHFNIMDGLDIYIDDYTKPDPMPAAMLAGLTHASTSLGGMFADDNKNAAADGPPVSENAVSVRGNPDDPAAVTGAVAQEAPANLPAEDLQAESNNPGTDDWQIKQATEQSGLPPSEGAV